MLWSPRSTPVLSDPAPGRSGGDLGQVLPLAVIVLLVALGAAVVMGQLGGRARDRALARTAADAAALAGVVDGRDAADLVAAENGAQLIGWSDRGREVEVRVRVGGAEAVAWATTDQIRVRPASPVRAMGAVHSRPWSPRRSRVRPPRIPTIPRSSNPAWRIQSAPNPTMARPSRWVPPRPTVAVPIPTLAVR